MWDFIKKIIFVLLHSPAELCIILLALKYAGVMELADVLDSKSSAFGRAGSTPATGTTTNNQ